MALNNLQLLNSDGTYGSMRGSAGYGSVVDQLSIPRLLVTPTVSGNPVGEMLVDCATGTIELVRGCINPGDDVVAAARLASGQPEVLTLMPGADPDEVAFSINPNGGDGEITDLYLLVLANGGTDSGADNIVDSSKVERADAIGGTAIGTVAMLDVTAAEILAATNMVHLEFDEADKVRDGVIRIGRTFDTSTQMWISVEGRSYA